MALKYYKKNKDLFGKNVIKFAGKSYQNLISNLGHHRRRQKYFNIIGKPCIVK